MKNLIDNTGIRHTQKRQQFLNTGDFYRVYSCTNYYGNKIFAIEHNGNECAVTHDKYVIYEGSHEACLKIHTAIKNDL